MATNRDLLKEAIADAKAVKETAIANAKAALEEAFTPFLKEKLASKIAEMDEVEELELEESEVSEVEKEMEKMKESDGMAEEISLDELLAELEAESTDDKGTQPEMEDKALYEAEGEDEEMSIEDMSEDDLKSFIEDVIKDMVSAGELEAGHEGMEGEEEEAGEEDEEEMDMEAGEEDGEEEINIDELLAEMEVDEYKKKATDPSKKSKNLAFATGGKKRPSDKSEVNDPQYTAKKAADVAGYMEEGQVDEYIEAASNPEAIAALATALGVPLAILASIMKDSKKKSKLAQDVKDIAAGEEMASESELEEANSTIEELRNELNEINLLNAKLLYTNKIFRNKSLTESQKVNVLTAFDKATSKKEAQLVYNTLTESLKASTATKTPLKESLGSASKVLGGNTSKPIIENDAFARMRELAFFGKNK